MKIYERTNHRDLWGNAKKSNEAEEPKYFCISCKYRLNNRCSVFNRFILEDYNRCFYHSHYSPITAAFKVPDNLESIMRKEAKRVA